MSMLTMRSMNRSWLATSLILTSAHHTATGLEYDQYTKGKARHSYSFELDKPPPNDSQRTLLRFDALADDMEFTILETSEKVLVNQLQYEHDTGREWTSRGRLYLAVHKSCMQVADLFI